MRRPVALACLVGLTACAPVASPPGHEVPVTALAGVDGRSYDLSAVSRGARATVVTFFSSSCPCQRAHDGRLRELHERYAPRGVAFLAVDSEADASVERDAAEAKQRGYRFPLVVDRDGRVARALGAEYATYTVIVDQRGAVRYRGGLDSDMHVLRDDARFWTRDALDRILAGDAPDPAETKALGCALRER